MGCPNYSLHNNNDYIGNEKMIEELLELNINCTQLVNKTQAQIVNEIVTQPYFLTGFILLFLVVTLFWVIFGCTHITEKKVCFESWVHWRSLIPLLLAIIIFLGWFIIGLPTLLVK